MNSLRLYGSETPGRTWKYNKFPCLHHGGRVRFVKIHWALMVLKNSSPATPPNLSKLRPLYSCTVTNTSVTRDAGHLWYPVVETWRWKSFAHSLILWLLWLLCLRPSVMYDLQTAAKRQDAELKMKSDKDGQNQKWVYRGQRKDSGYIGKRILKMELPGRGVWWL